MKKLFFIIGLLGLFNGALPAQGEVSFRIAGPAEAAPAGSILAVEVHADISPGWHLYSMDIPPGGPIPTSFKVTGSEVFSSGGEARQSEPVSWFDENFDMETNYFEGSALFTVPIRVAESAAPGEYELYLQAEFMLCNDSICLPPQKQDLHASVEVTEGDGASEPDWGGTLPAEDEAAVAGNDMPFAEINARDRAARGIMRIQQESLRAFTGLRSHPYPSQTTR